ncbi:hypothetical protein LCGC14_1166280 [marine sediment metagenome]|uniref:Uncharacterized protein n=1 Tax=marine sediment metagenome TaxID=412755 RepID=A0A0F9LR96_9ZZZZ
MPEYVLPQALVFQEFQLVPTALVVPLRATPVGPQYALFRYSDSDEKPGILVAGSYNPDADESFAWPGRPAGSVVDFDYTKVYMDDALLLYYSDAVGAGSEIRAVAGYRNRVRFDALVLQTKNGFDRSGVFGDRDVSPGDVLDIVASACGDPYRVRTQILELLADPVPAVIGDADADVSNKANLVVGGTQQQSAGAYNQVYASDVDASAYDGRDDGQVQETYKVMVVSGSAGGDAETAVLRVTALSGTESAVEITPSDFGTPTAIGSRGLLVTFNNTGSSSSSSGQDDIDPDDFVAGQEWTITAQQDYEAPEGESGGVYLGAADTVYIVEVIKGGDFGTAQIRVTTNTGIDSSGPTTVPALDTALPIGTQGTTFKFTAADNGLCKGERFTVPVEAAGIGAVKTAVVSTPLSPALRGICEVDLGGGSSSSSSGTPPDLSVDFFIKVDIEVTENRLGFAPLINWEQSETEITLKTGIVAYDASWTVGGVLQPLPVKDGKVYAHYRALVQQWVSTIGTLDDVALIEDTFDQAPIVHPDNPLVYGVYNALLNANGTDVKFTAVGASSPIELEDWLETLEVLKGRDDVYSLVPLTFDKQVQDAFVAHAEAMSAADVGRWRIVWLCAEASTEKSIYVESTALGADSGDPVLATITDDPETSGTQYTLLSAEGEHFITDSDADVAVGDIVRAQYQDDGFGNLTYQEYVIDAILNDEDLRLHTGPSAPVNTPSKVEIWRNLNRTQIATEQALKPGLWSTRRAYLVWPDEIGNAGMTVAGYFLCCSLAGLRSASLPHRPLTNVEIIGWDDLSRTTEFFNEPQLNILAASGYWIVTQDPNDGQVFTRHQLSTNNLDLNRREQSVTTNVDSISYTFLRRLAIYIGRGNVTPVMIGIVEGEILSILDYYSNFVVQDILGPQVISYGIRQLEQHPLLKDRILAVVDLEIPYPLNNIELHLVV